MPNATIGPPKSLTSLLIGGNIGEDLASLVALLEAGHLAVNPRWRGSSNHIGEAAEAMLNRALRGKATLDIDGPQE